MLKKLLRKAKKDHGYHVSLYEKIVYGCTDYDVVDFIYDKFIYPTQRFYYMLKRAIYWGYKLRYSHDWDFHYVEEMILIKLSKMREEISTDGTCGWIENDRSINKRSLNLAIKLLKRLIERSEHFYNEPAYIKHNEKWGHIEFTTAKIEGSTSSRFITSRENVVTHGDEIRESYEMREIMESSHRMRTRDRKLVYAILEKYGQEWWT